MKITDGEKIIEALNVIKSVCENNSENCSKCPFDIAGTCGVTDLQPCNWKIGKYNKFQALE